MFVVLSIGREVQQSTSYFLDQALFLYIGAMCIAMAMKKTSCYVKKLFGKVKCVPRIWQLLSRVAFPMVKKKQETSFSLTLCKQQYHTGRCDGRLHSRKLLIMFKSVFLSMVPSRYVGVNNYVI